MYEMSIALSDRWRLCNIIKGISIEERRKKHIASKAVEKHDL